MTRATIHRSLSAGRAWLEARLKSARFYARVAHQTGLKGLMASLRVWRASRAVSQAYTHIEQEQDMHDQQMVLLRYQLDQAQRNYHQARACIHGLHAGGR